MLDPLQQLECQEVAEKTWSIFRAFCAAGFTEEQALHLVSVLMQTASRPTT